MQINPIQHSNKSNNNVAFTSLKGMKFINDFNPKKSPEDVKIIKNFLANQNIKNLLKKYDVWATFDKHQDSYYMDIQYEILTMKCKKVPADSDKNSILKSIKSLFQRDKRDSLEIKLEGGYDCMQDSDMVRLSDKIINVTDTELELQLVRSERNLLANKLHSIELNNVERNLER